jgi:hypothetical protein
MRALAGVKWWKIDVAINRVLSEVDRNQGNQCELRLQLWRRCWSCAWSVLLCLGSREHPEGMTRLRIFDPAARCPIDDLQGATSARAVTCKRLVISPKALWHMLWAL